MGNLISRKEKILQSVFQFISLVVIISVILIVSDTLLVIFDKASFFRVKVSGSSFLRYYVFIFDYSMLGLFAISLAVIYAISRFMSKNHSKIYLALRVVAIFIVYSLLILYVANWFNRYMSGEFISGLNFISFFSALTHRPVLLISLLLLGAVSILVLYFLDNLLCKIKPAVCIHVSFIFLIIIFVQPFLLKYITIDHTRYVYDSEINLPYQKTRMVQRMRERESGPMAYYAGLIAGKRNYTRILSKAQNEFAIQRNKIIPMREYFENNKLTQLKHYNVLMIQINALTKSELMVYHSKRSMMPTLDALAMQSRVFMKAFASATTDNLNDLVVFNSRYPLYVPGYIYPKKTSYPRVLIYDILHELGYKTAIFSSKNENPSGMSNYLQTNGLSKFLHAGNYTGSVYDSNGAEQQYSSLNSGIMKDKNTVSEAIKWLRSKKTSDPFFLALNLQNFQPSIITTLSSHNLIKVDNKIIKNQSKLAIDKEDALLQVDAQVKRLFEYMNRNHLMDNTIIILVGGSHGTHEKNNLIVRKNYTYNPNEIPLIVYLPGEKPMKVSKYVDLVDVAPTVLDVLNMPPHPSFQGASLLAKLDNPYLFIVDQDGAHAQYSIIFDGIKYNFDMKKNTVSAYDLLGDKGETSNIINNLIVAQAVQVNFVIMQFRAWYGLHLYYLYDNYWHNREYPPKFKKLDSYTKHSQNEKI